MAKSIELTLEEAKQHPECFMYVWATDQFLAAIEPKYAKIIGAKRANQKKVLMLSVAYTENVQKSRLGDGIFYIHICVDI